MLVVRPSTDSFLTWSKIGFAIWNRNYTKMGTNTKKKKWHLYRLIIIRKSFPLPFQQTIGTEILHDSTSGEKKPV